MTDRIVCDASVVIAALLDNGPDGQWSADVLRGAELAAPAIVLFESANVLRRLELTHMISADQAAQAHADLRDLPIELWPYELLADRVWGLRANLTAYDASYVALAEQLPATLVTLDRRLARASGPRFVINTR